MAFLILLALILINGVFAMSELAVVSVNKARLRQKIEDDDDQAAKTALKLADDPNRFLSTVQIGITLVGVFSGAFGGSTIARQITPFIVEQTGVSESVAGQISIGAIVVLTTYLSLVIGELVPKRIALNNPERMAMLIARPMHWLSRLSAPLVWFLSKSTEIVTGLIGIQSDDNDFITDFEVISMMREGITSGEFNTDEHEMVKGALELDDRRVREIATPRTDVVWFDINAEQDEIRQILKDTTYSAYVVADGTIEDIVGIVRTKDLLTHMVTNDVISLRDILHEPFYVPESAVAADVLQRFKTTDVHMALVVGEYGGLKGIVSLNDIVEQVLGDLDMQDIEPVQRKDGSWLIDGQYPVIDLPALFDDFNLPGDEKTDYHTMAGFVLARLGHIPSASDSFEWGDYNIEVMDMDNKRVDKVLVTPRSDDIDDQ